ncbi:MAG: hypothetical protein FJZ97_09345, partial [Chloroflexi bacterium]|nr:hypothetical protein [Chloroflexota bacterium]
MPLEYIDRPPRMQPELPTGTVKIPTPPEKQGATLQTLISLILPLITVLGFVFASGSGNMGMMVTMGLAMGASAVFGVISLRAERRDAAEKDHAYQMRLAEMRQEMLRSHNTQRMFFHYNYPDVPSLIEVAARKETSRFGSRIWERRPTDPDFGIVRLGIGSRKSTVVYKIEGADEAVDPSPLHKDALRLATDSQILNDVPITIPLRPVNRDESGKDEDRAPKDSEMKEKLSGLYEPPRHSLGIFGKSPTQTADFARAVLAHFCTFHSSQDSRLYVIGHPSSSSGWEWAEWLPHCIVRGFGDDDDSGKPRPSDQLCFSAKPADVRGFWKRIKVELDQRQVRLKETKDQEGGKGTADITLPFLLIVVDLLGEAPAITALKDVASEDVIATLNRDGPTLGAAVVFLVDEPSKVPSDCQAMVEVAAVGEQVVFRYIEVGLNTPRYLGVADLLKPVEAR